MLKQYITYIFTNTIGMICISLYILADTFFIAKGVGPIGLAALGIVVPFWSLFAAISYMIAIGGSTRYAILSGMGLTKKANRVYSTTVHLGLIISLILVLVSIFGTHYVITLLGVNDDTYTNTYIYFKVLVFLSPILIFNNILVAFTRNDKKPKLAMVCMVMGNLINVVLDYIFVIKYNMGMFGASLATGISPIFIIILIIFSKRDYRFYINELNFYEAKKIISLGFAAFVMEVSQGIVILIFNLLLLKNVGTNAVAAYSIIINYAYVIMSVFNGISQGMQAIISRYLHLKEKFLRYTLIISGLAGVLIYSIMYKNAYKLVLIFNEEKNIQMQNVATNGIKIYFFCVFFASINIVLIMYYTAISKSKEANILSMSRGLILIIPLVYILSYFFGVNGIWISVPLAEILTIIVFVFSKKVLRCI